MPLSKHILILLLLLYPTHWLRAQMATVDQGKTLFAKGEASWFQRNLPEAKVFFWEYLKKEKLPNDTNDVVNANDLMANVYLTLGAYDSALHYSSAAFTAISKIKSKRFWGNINQTKGRIHLQLGDLSTAIQCILLADSFYMASTEKILHDIAPYSAIALASIYSEQKQLDKAREYYELASERVSNLPNTQVWINCLENLAGFYISNKEYAKANELYNKILAGYNPGKVIPMRLYTYIGLGDIHQGYKNFDSAMYYYQLSKDICVARGEMYQLDAMYVKIAWAFLQAGKLNEAALHADSTLLWLSKTNNINLAIEACNILTEVSLKRQQFEKAVLYLTKKEAYTDSLLSMKNLEVSNNLYILNKVRQKDDAIALLNRTDQINKGLIKKSSLISYLLLGIVCLFALFFVIYLNRVKLKKQLEKQTAVAQERERIITDLHDDVGATLSSMHIYGDLAKSVWHTQPHKSMEMVSKMTQQAKDLMARMGDIIWSMKPAAEERYALTTRLTNFSNELLAPKNIVCHFDIDETLVTEIRTPEVRKNILLITKEAMNNIAKYSGAENAFISFKKIPESVVLTISDNGIGFNAAQVKNGNGLQNIMRRCKQINGACNIKAELGKGVIITCSFPVGIIGISI